MAHKMAWRQKATSNYLKQWRSGLLIYIYTYIYVYVYVYVYIYTYIYMIHSTSINYNVRHLQRLWNSYLYNFLYILMNWILDVFIG